MDLHFKLFPLTVFLIYCKYLQQLLLCVEDLPKVKETLHSISVNPNELNL